MKSKPFIKDFARCGGPHRSVLREGTSYVNLVTF
jgi:hypothetical protein